MLPHPSVTGRRPHRPAPFASALQHPERCGTALGHSVISPIGPGRPAEASAHNPTDRSTEEELPWAPAYPKSLRSAILILTPMSWAAAGLQAGFFLSSETLPSERCLPFGRE